MRVLAVVLVVLAACSGSFAERANRTLTTSLAVTNAARDQFLAWDAAHQQEIVATSATREEAESRLAAYRTKRVAVVKAFTYAYVTIGTAAALVPLVERGIKRDVDLVPLLTEVAVAVAAVRDAYKTLSEGAP